MNETAKIELKEQLKILSLIVPSTIIVLVIFILTPIPEEDKEENLSEQIESTELSIFRELANQNIIPEKTLKEINIFEAKKSYKESDADKLWNSIEVGEVIAKRGVGGTRTVGKNRKVQKLRTEAEGLGGKIVDIKRVFARNFGNNLLSTESEHLWYGLKNLQSEIDDLHERNSWYYKSFLGPIFFFFKMVLNVLLFIGTPISALLIIIFVFDLIGLLTNK